MAEKIDYSKGIYDAKQLGTPKLLILGAQHMFAMLDRKSVGRERV